MLTKVQEDLECSQRSRRIHKYSKFYHIKFSLKLHQCIELGDSFPTTQKSPQTKFVCKRYGWSKFESTKGKKEKVKGSKVTCVTTKRVTHGMTL
jgi:hypothetical protein